MLQFSVILADSDYIFSPRFIFFYNGHKIKSGITILMTFLATNCYYLGFCNTSNEILSETTIKITNFYLEKQYEYNSVYELSSSAA